MIPFLDLTTREVLSLPCFAGLRDDEIDEVARAVRRACESV